MANTPSNGFASRLVTLQSLSPLGAEADGEDIFPEIDGHSPEISTLKQHMRSVARDPFVTVLIQGESGTGKERVAAAIHRASPRRRAPFIVINCAGFSSSLIEDELFGHTRGAFTGAVADRPGPFERADGGTVFLDEIGELTIEAQARLLRALQERTIQRLGGQRDTAFDVRIIAATHVALSEAVAQGRFREDLFYRLNVYELNVPALRTRGLRDIQTLTTAILQRLASRRHQPPPSLDSLVLDTFAHYGWPGNVRELENTLERMLVHADGGPWLRLEHLPARFFTPGPRPEGETNRKAAMLPAAAKIEQAIERHSGRLGRAAIDLGLSRHQLYRALKRRGATEPREIDHA